MICLQSIELEPNTAAKDGQRDYWLRLEICTLTGATQQMDEQRVIYWSHFAVSKSLLMFSAEPVAVCLVIRLEPAIVIFQNVKRSA